MTGLILFLFYFACYTAFVFVNAFAPATMERELWRGVNLAVASGFGLIALAMALAGFYGWLCRTNPVNRVEEVALADEKVRS
jgi:uncharacterized membrane protein (DUF485 family)